jgi:hypothetical protein
MRISEDTLFEQSHVLMKLRGGIQAAASVIEINVPIFIKARIIFGT